MKLPFTIEQFFEVFRNYNLSVYPMQIVFYLLGFTVIFLSIKKVANADRIMNGILSFLWLWMGVVYHILYFAPINKAAYLFGGIFILQGLQFFYQGILKNKLSYKFHSGKEGWVGALLITFALIIYPLQGAAFGHVYPASPTFGLPCPTTIFTFGMLLWAEQKIPLSIIAIPFIWSIIGFFAALKLGVREDTWLLIAAIIGTILITFRNKKIRTSTI